VRREQQLQHRHSHVLACATYIHSGPRPTPRLVGAPDAELLGALRSIVGRTA